MNNNVTNKIISLLITGIFVFQQVVWAAEESNISTVKFNSYRENITVEEPILPENIYIPEDLAQIETKNFDNSKEIIFNLQDCHSSLSAQYSIVNILKKLLNNYEMNIVAIEGASGYIDTSILKSFPDKKIKEEAAAALMKEGKLSAGEFFSIVTDEDVALYGVEDEALYSRNLESFRQLYRDNKVALKDVKKILRIVEKAEEAVYSKELSMFIFKSRLHAASKISFEIYGKYLLELCSQKKIESSNIKNITSFLEVINIEKGIDFNAATLESKELLSDLMDIASKGELEGMVLKTLEFNKDKIGPVEYHDWLFSFAKQKGKDISEYLSLLEYVDYIKHYQTLDIIGLQSDIDLLEEQILDELFDGKKDRELYQQAKLIQLIKALFSIQLTPKNVAYVEEHLSKFNEDNIKSVLSGTYNNEKSEFLNLNIPKIRSRAMVALDFYIIAEKRNIAMISNTIKNMRSEGKNIAALISGGHHSRGLSKLMQEKGVSYFILMPKYSIDSERPYVAILTKKKGPYRELVKSGAYDLALEAYFDSGDIEELEEMIGLVVGGWAIQNKVDIESITQQWAGSYEEYYEQIIGARKGALKYTQLRPEEFKEFLSDIKILDKKEDSCNISLKGKIYTVDSNGIYLMASSDGMLAGIESEKNKALGVKQTTLNRYDKINFILNKVTNLGIGRGLLQSNIPIILKLLIFIVFDSLTKGRSFDSEKAEVDVLKKDRSILVSEPAFILNEFIPYQDLSDKEMKKRYLRIDALKDYIDQLLENKVYMIALSAQITKDHVLVAEWGKVRVSGVDKCVYELTYDEYESAPGIGKVVRLDELFEAAKGRIDLDINIKSWAHDILDEEGVSYQDSVVLHLVDMIRSSDMETDVSIVSYKNEYIQKVKVLDPEIKVGLTLKEEITRSELRSQIDALISEANDMGAINISVYPEQLDEVVIDKIHSAGLTIIGKQSKKEIPINIWEKIDYLYVKSADLGKDRPRISYDSKEPEDIDADGNRDKSDIIPVLTTEILAETVRGKEKLLDPFVIARNFLTGLPPRITNKYNFSKDLFENIYNLTNEVAEDSGKVSISFFEREKSMIVSGEKQKIVMIYLDQPGIKEKVDSLKQDIARDSEIKLGKEDGFSVSGLSGVLSEMTLLVDVITIAKEKRYLNEAEKEALLTKLNTPGYSGFTSPENRMAVGYALFRDTGDDLTVKDIIYNIVPVAAQYNREVAEIILYEYLEGLDKIIEDIREQLTSLPFIFDEIVEKTKSEFLQLPTEGTRIYKLRPEMVLTANIDKAIEGLERNAGLEERSVIADLMRLKEYIREKIPYFDLVGEDILREEKETFDLAIEEVIAEEVSASSSDSKIAEMINILLLDIKNKVDRELNESIAKGKGYRVVIVLESMEKKYRGLISRTKKEIKGLSGKSKEGKEKFLDDYQFILDLLKKTASSISRKGKPREDFLLDKLSAVNRSGKYVLFVEGDLLPSDIKKIHKNVIALVTTTAGTSAHWVLVANNFNIPVFHLTGKGSSSVLMQELKKEIAPGILVAINGGKGEMIVDPNDDTLRQFRKESRDLDAYEIFCSKEAKKKAYIGEKTGNKEKVVKVKANADEKAELIAAFAKGADGIGLVRTEEFWLSEEDTPRLKDFIEDINNDDAANDVREFFREKALSLFRHAIKKNKKGDFEINEITLRTIDVADDKQVPFDPSDLIGMKYYREKDTGEALLELQLEAVYEAIIDLIRILMRDEELKALSGKSSDVLDAVVQRLKGKIKIKFPQVESKQDIIFALDKVKDSLETVILESGVSFSEVENILQSVVKIGSMIESSRAVNNLEEILPFSDFISIGSNDLIRDLYRVDVERYLGNNLRRDIRARRFTKEIRGRVLGQFEQIIEKVAIYNGGTEKKISVTVCGDTATIDSYTLQTLYLCNKYNVEVALSVPRMKIGEKKAFIRYADKNGLVSLFERGESSYLYRTETLLWKMIDDMDILEVLSDVINLKIKKKARAKVHSLLTKAMAIKSLIENTNQNDLMVLLDFIIEDSLEAISAFNGNSEQIKDMLKDYLQDIRIRINMLDSKIGQRGKIEAEAENIRDRIHSEPEIKNTAKILLEKGLFQVEEEKVDSEREEIEQLFEEDKKVDQVTIQETKPIEEEKTIRESVYLKVINKKGLHGRPAIDLFKQPQKLGVKILVEDGYSVLQKKSIKAAYEELLGSGSWPGKVDEAMFFVYLQATRESILKLSIEGTPERVKAMRSLLDNLDEVRSVDIEEDITGKIKIELKDHKAEVLIDKEIERSGKIVLKELSPLDPDEKIFNFMDESEFEENMNELLPGRVKGGQDRELAEMLEKVFLQTDEQNLVLGLEEIEALKRLILMDGDEVFKKMWPDKIKLQVFPLLKVLKQTSGEDYVARIYKIMKLFAHIGNNFFEEKSFGTIDVVDINVFGEKIKEDDYGLVIKAMEPLFLKDIKDINDESVRAEIKKSNWEDIFGLKLANKKSDDGTSLIPGIFIITPDSEKIFNVHIAMPEDIYRKVDSFIGISSFISRLDLPWGASITKVRGQDVRAVTGEVNRLTQNKKGIVLILDQSSFDLNVGTEAFVEDLSNIILDFMESIKKDVLTLLSPETITMDRASVERLEEFRVREIMDILVKLHDKCRSYNLSEKSVYQMRIENAFELSKNKEGSIELIATSMKKDRNSYLVHFADAAEFMDRKELLIVPPGVEIQSRRAVQDLDGKIDPYKDKFYIIAPYENMTDSDKNNFKKQLMDLWMLDEIVHENDIIILDRKEGGYKTSDIYDMVNGAYEKVGKQNTGFRVICGELDYDKNSAENKLLQLELPEGAEHNRDQYEIFINLLSSRGGDFDNFYLPSAVSCKRSNLYIFMPTTLPVDLDREIRSYYERYKEEVLIKA